MIKVLESKSIVVAVLTVIAGVAAYYGANLPVATIIGLLTPLMIAIGAAGWSDAVKMKAKMSLEHDVRMHALMHGNTTLNGVTRDAEGRVPRAPQAGFAKIGVMLWITAALGFAFAANEGCTETKTVISDGVDCIKAEGKALSGGLTLVQLAMQVYDAVSNGTEEQLAEQWILKYGGDVVACVMDEVPTPAAGSGMKTSLIAERKQAFLQKHFAGKKLNHGTAQETK